MRGARWLIILPLAWAMLVAATPSLQPPSPSPTLVNEVPEKEGASGPAEADQEKNTTDKPVPPVGQEKSSVDSGVANDAGNQEKDGTSVEDAAWWTTRFTGILAIAAVLQLISAFWQGVSIKRSADAAGDSARATNEALHIQRPFMIVTSVNPNFRGWTPDGGGYYEISVMAENFGVGPALIRRFELAIQEFGGSLPVDFSECAFYELGSSEPVPPQKNWSGQANLAQAMFDPETQAKIQNGYEHIVAYGKITYTDIRERTYTTGYCWIFSPLDGSDFKTCKFTRVQGTPLNFHT